MYFLETNIFWPNPHPTKTYHTKFPVLPQASVPLYHEGWYFIYLIFPFKNPPILGPLVTSCLGFLGSDTVLLNPLNLCSICFCLWTLFSPPNNEISPTWHGAINSPRYHRESLWLLPGITIQPAIGHPRRRKAIGGNWASGKHLPWIYEWSVP